MEIQKRRIAFVHGIFPFGGGERVTLDIAAYLTRYNYEIFVFTRAYYSENLSLEQRAIPLEAILLPNKKVHRSGENASVIIDNVKKNKIAVLVFIGRRPRYVSLIKKATACACVYFLHSQPFWEIKQKIGYAIQKKKGSFFGVLKWYLWWWPMYGYFKTIYRSVPQDYKKYYDLMDYFIVLCAGYKEELVKRLGLNPSDNKIRVMSNTEKRVASVCWEKKKKFLFVGRLTYAEKRVDRLISIWAKIYRQLPEWELIIVGDGAERARLEKQAQGLDRVRFVGFSKEVSVYYRTASFLCLVSELDAFPLCLTEAQANGVIPVAFACSAGVREILSPSGEHGFLIPPYDLNEYARTLLELARKPESELLALRQKVVQKAASYSMEQVGPQWLALLDELYL